MKRITISPIVIGDKLYMQARTDKSIISQHFLLLKLMTSKDTIKKLNKDTLRFTPYAETEVIDALQTLYQRAIIRNAIDRMLYISPNASKINNLHNELVKADVLYLAYKGERCLDSGLNRLLVFFDHTNANKIFSVAKKYGVLGVSNGTLG